MTEKEPQIPQPSLYDATLARVDERTKTIQNELSQFRDDLRNSITSVIGTIKDVEVRQKKETDDLSSDIKEAKTRISTVETSLYAELDKNYVKKVEFEPIKKLSYYLIGFVLTAILSAGLTLIVKSGVSVSSSPAAVSTTQH